MFQPWGKLRQLAHIEIIWTRPHSHAPPATDGTSRIWLDPNLNQTEHRCALTHELIHIQHGHCGCQTPAIERLVRWESARLLINFEHLAHHARWAHSLPELAEELMVTEDVLIDRLQTLDGDQLQRLWPSEDHVA
ncbi:hypothetical protein BLJ79_03525 [Arthrobacter sp. UCD-GKA]|uniref:hypothetical protein n=1 Tax=Arthrobacter sp. UCD-GKA TaxID=1913576 RepID=UPI0008DDF939|nr:hypothetical protein [Arthrobacter sp. UCD-GKA]OIH85886.1 hypothetical protein BLJ79_03525 [Arthrobacter sp. UCD-GKA]